MIGAEHELERKMIGQNVIGWENKHMIGGGGQHMIGGRI